MKKIRHPDIAFRTTFVVLVVAALVALCWECADWPGGPSRVGWPAIFSSRP